VKRWVSGVLCVIAVVGTVATLSACAQETGVKEPVPSVSGTAPNRGGSSLDGLIGYWRTPDDANFPDSHIRIDKREGIYYLSIDGTLPEPLNREADRLVLPWLVGEHHVQLGVDNGVPTIFAWVSERKYPRPGQQRPFYWAPFRIHPATKTEYVRAARVKDDLAMHLGIGSLDYHLRSWAAKHGGVLPAPGEVRFDSAFGRWFAAQADWPINPYTGAPMTPGRGPGDFLYGLDGSERRELSLTGFYRDGRAFTPADTPPVHE
jgi:hypothetical protein